MFKLIKYEIRKNRAPLLIVLTAIAAMEIYFLCSLVADSEINVVISTSLLPFAFFLVALTVFIMGVSAYSRELRQKSSYLVFMTPHGTLAIVASKILFTVVIGLFFSALLAALLAMDVPLLSDYFGEWRGFYELFNAFMQNNGLNLQTLLLTAAYFALSVFLQLVSTVGVAYLAITLSATLLQNKKGKGLVSFVLFVVILYALGYLSALYSGALTDPQTAPDLLRALSPVLLQNIAVLLGSLFGCAWMLKRAVSL